MTHVLRAELLRLVHRRSGLGLAAGAALFAAVVGLSIYASASDAPAGPAGRRSGASVASLSGTGGCTEAFVVGASFVGFFVFVTVIALMASGAATPSWASAGPPSPPPPTPPWPGRPPCGCCAGATSPPERQWAMASALTDAHGVPLGGPPEGVAAYDRALDRLLRFHPDVLTAAGELTTIHPGTAMGHALVAYLNLMGTNPADLPGAAAAAAALARHAAHPRELGHVAAVEAWLGGDWLTASDVLDTVLEQWPADLLALAIGHQLDFFLGDAANLRDRVGRSLPALDPDHPHTGFVRGMYAFGLEEAGHYGQAEEAGLAAVAANADDVWATHAVVHTYEMQGLVDTGARFLLDRQGHWGAGNLFTVHNWWHLALYALEAGDTGRALAVYDAEIHHATSAGVPIEMLDASALLWRLLLDGSDTGGRFAPLADAWEPLATGDPWYAFNDLHAVMALVGDDRLAEAQAVIDRLRAWLPSAQGTNALMTARIGLPACAAVVAFAQGRYADVIAELQPIRSMLHLFGGSHAQRDALQRTLVEAALRAQRPSLAAALTAERVSRRERSYYNWIQRARALREQGHEAEAAAAEARAADHQRTFAAAFA